MKAAIYLAFALALTGCASPSNSVNIANSTGRSTEPIKVTEENFIRAESDKYFSARVKAGGFGKLSNLRELMSIENQSVIRSNRDTLYSPGVFDLEAGPVTITLPDPGKRFMSALVIDQDEYALKAVYAPATFTVSKSDAETRYVLIGVRTFVDPNDPKDVDAAHTLQDAIKVEQASTGSFEIPNWDSVSRDSVRAELLKRAARFTDSRGMFGPRGKVDPERHLIGAASGWGGNFETDALYLTVVPPKNDGKTILRLTIKDVPVEAFWSISVYGPDGYFHKNDQNSYSINNITGKKAADGSVTIQFGGCDGSAPNCIPITEDWNYWVRLYRPRKEILDGTWKFPEPKVVP